MPILVKVPDAPLERDICFTDPCKFQCLAMEPTLSTVREGHVAFALVIHTTRGLVFEKHGVYHGDELVYYQKVLQTPLAVAARQ